jgi:transposase-like protein
VKEGSLEASGFLRRRSEFVCKSCNNASVRLALSNVEFQIEKGELTIFVCVSPGMYRRGRRLLFH